MQIGRKIYYEIATGNIILDTGDRNGDVVEMTLEQDFAAYAALAERVPDTVGMMQLEYGQYSQDFAECIGYRVDVSGAVPAIVFSYPDPAYPNPEPVYQKPLSVQVAEQQQALDDLTLAIADLLGA